jgi:TPR repeat protein
MDAQYYLGIAYTKGEGVKQSGEKAFEWFLAAALQGHPDAQTRVFNAYTTGQGVVQSTEKARAWLLRLVEQDNAMAQLYLALEYDHRGQHEKARAWFERAEDNGIMLEGIDERLKTNGNSAKSQQ